MLPIFERADLFVQNVERGELSSVQIPGRRALLSNSVSHAIPLPGTCVSHPWNGRRQELNLHSGARDRHRSPTGQGSETQRGTEVSAAPPRKWFSRLNFKSLLSSEPSAPLPC